MRNSTATLGTALLVSAIAACSGERTPDPGNIGTNNDVALVVDNDHWLDVTIYALRAGIQHRVGTVSGLSEDTVAVPNAVVAGTHSVRFLLEPIGSANTHVTDQIVIPAAGEVAMNIRSPLSLTFVSLPPG